MRDLMTRALPWLAALALQATGVEYSVTDISDWSPAQLDGLPHFHDHVPYLPAGASSNLQPVCHSETTLVGTISYNDSFVQLRGAVVENGVQAMVDALGTFYWSRTGGTVPTIISPMVASTSSR